MGGNAFCAVTDAPGGLGTSEVEGGALCLAEVVEGGAGEWSWGMGWVGGGVHQEGWGGGGSGHQDVLCSDGRTWWVGCDTTFGGA